MVPYPPHADPSRGPPSTAWDRGKHTIDKPDHCLGDMILVGKATLTRIIDVEEPVRVGHDDHQTLVLDQALDTQEPRPPSIVAREPMQ